MRQELNLGNVSRSSNSESTGSNDISLVEAGRWPCLSGSSNHNYFRKFPLDWKGLGS